MPQIHRIALLLLPLLFVSCVYYSSESSESYDDSYYDETPVPNVEGFNATSMDGYVLLSGTITSRVHNNNYDIELYRFTSRDSIVLIDVLNGKDASFYYFYCDSSVSPGTYAYYTIIREHSTDLISPDPNGRNVTYSGKFGGPQISTKDSNSVWIEVKIMKAPFGVPLYLAENDSVHIELYRQKKGDSLKTVIALQPYSPETTWDIFSEYYDEIQFNDTLLTQGAYSYFGRYVFGDGTTSQWSTSPEITFDPCPKRPNLYSVFSQGETVQIDCGRAKGDGKAVKLYIHRIFNNKDTVFTYYSRDSESTIDSTIAWDTPSEAGTYHYYVQSCSYTGALSPASDTLSVMFQAKPLAPILSISHLFNVVTASVSTDPITYNYKKNTLSNELLMGTTPNNLTRVPINYYYNGKGFFLDSADTYYFAAVAKNTTTGVYGDTSQIQSIIFDGDVGTIEDFSLSEANLKVIGDNKQALLWRSTSPSGPYIPLGNDTDTTIYLLPKGTYYYRVSKLSGSMEGPLSTRIVPIDYKGAFEVSNLNNYIYFYKYQDSYQVASQGFYNRAISVIIEESTNQSAFSPVCTLTATKLLSDTLPRLSGNYSMRAIPIIGAQQGSPVNLTPISIPGNDTCYFPLLGVHTKGDTLTSIYPNYAKTEQFSRASLTFFKGDSLIHTFTNVSNGVFYGFYGPEGNDYHYVIKYYFLDNTWIEIVSPNFYHAAN